MSGESIYLYSSPYIHRRSGSKPLDGVDMCLLPYLSRCRLRKFWHLPSLVNSPAAVVPNLLWHLCSSDVLGYVRVRSGETLGQQLEKTHHVPIDIRDIQNPTCRRSEGSEEREEPHSSALSL